MVARARWHWRIRALASALLALAAGAAVGSVALDAGAAPSRPELLRIAGQVGAIAAFGGLVSAAAWRPRDRWGVAICALGPPLALLWIAQLPRIGRVVERVSDGGLVAVGIAALGVGALARSRARRGGALLLVAFWTAGVGALASAGRVGGPPAATGPELLVVTLDTTRADALAPWSARAVAPTPRLDALAASARVYRQAFAPVALTGPSHAVLWSGRADAADAVPVNGVPLPAGMPWLPAELETAGWHTLAVVSAAVLDHRLGFCRGFSRCDSAFDQRLRRASRVLGARGVRTHAGSAHRRADPETVTRALDLWDRAAGDRPRALWVHLYGAHGPYAPGEAAARAVGLSDATPLPSAALPSLTEERWTDAERQRGRALYAAQMVELDEQLGRLLDAVGPDTVVAVVGDHGESLGEHGYTFAHGRLGFAPDVAVPLLLRAPGLPPGPDAQVVGLDAVAPALRALLGRAPAEETIVGDEHPDRLVVTRTWARAQPDGPGDLGPLASIAVRGPTRTVAVSRWHPLAAYDRVADPTEEVPLAVSPQDAALVARLQEELARSGAAPAGEASQGAALEALGYIDPAGAGAHVGAAARGAGATDAGAPGQ